MMLNSVRPGSVLTSSADGAKSAQRGGLNSAGRGRVKIGGAKMHRGARGVLVVVIERALFDTDFRHRQGAVFQDAHGGFATENSLLHQHLGVVPERLRQRRGQEDGEGSATRLAEPESSASKY